MTDIEELFPGRTFRALLFDMDGTLINSIASSERVWGAWARRHGLDVTAFLPTMHGKRAAETIGGTGLTGIDVEAEAKAVLQAEIDDVEGIFALGGVAAFLDALPRDRWSIVTSAPIELATRRLEAAGLALPPMIVAAGDVAHGKPAPDCFLLAAGKLGIAPADCLVFEDAPAGIAAAEAAGMTVVVIDATHSHAPASSHPRLGSYDGLQAMLQSDGSLAVVRHRPEAAAR